MILLLTQFAIGFSLISAAILLLAYLFSIKDMRKTLMSRVACTLLLLALAGLQLQHWQFIASGADLFASQIYVFLLIGVPPAFYFFSREILLPDTVTTLSDVVHLLPLSLAFVMPTSLVVPVALTIGAGYSIWLVRIVYGMRRHVRRFRFELFFFGFFALLAVLILILAITSAQLDPAIFFYAYAITTAVAFILVVSALIGFPELLSDISAAAELTYSTSTLNNVDVDEKLRELDRLMAVEKIFQNENLNLGLLADALELGPHQLSELINTRFDLGFSRYIREQRIAEAMKQLRKDKAASVLSISMATGFRSQSNFYTAFREVTGQSPGEFRKNLNSGS
tara:strand:+ start:21212 stop:22228 length:1017 start_codon:yes stop_codon:yes gene_type:complete